MSDWIKELAGHLEQHTVSLSADVVAETVRRHYAALITPNAKAIAEKWLLEMRKLTRLRLPNAEEDKQADDLASDIQAAIDEAYQRGRADERKEVVEWYRKSAALLRRVMDDTPFGKLSIEKRATMEAEAKQWSLYADYIERGEHLKGE